MDYPVLSISKKRLYAFVHLLYERYNNERTNKIIIIIIIIIIVIRVLIKKNRLMVQNIIKESGGLLGPWFSSTSPASNRAASNRAAST